MRKKLIIGLLAILAATTAAAGELEIGSKAPSFALIDAATGRYVKFEPRNSNLSVVVFTCNQCPYAKAFEPRLIELGRKYGKKGVTFVAVNPNDESTYPEESIGNMKSRALGEGYPFPYVKDTDSSVARAYGAKVTPHVFVVDSQGTVQYRGYVDDSAKPREREHTGLSDALDSLLADKPVERTVTKAFGCTIKWKTTM